MNLTDLYYLLPDRFFWWLARRLGIAEYINFLFVDVDDEEPALP